MQSYPSHVVLLHMGGLGDLVLSAPLCERMLSGNGTRVTMICRSHVAAVMKLFPHPPDTVIPLELNPHEWTEATDELVTKLGNELQKIPRGRADLFLSIEHQPTWLAPIVAAHIGARDSAYARLDRRAAWFARSVLRTLGVAAVKVRMLEAHAHEHETIRYARLAGRSEAPPPRIWPIREETKHAARTWLDASGFSFGRYIACFPGSGASTPLKRFPLERFADAFEDVLREFALPVLLIGNADERRDLEDLSNELQMREIGSQVVACEPDDVHLLAGLLRGALAFVGNDTGLEHLAGALGVPGVTIFARETWPQYAPVAFGHIGLIAPLTFFGGSWDGVFSFGPCADSIASTEVSRALRSLLVSKHSEARVEAIQRRSPHRDVPPDRANQPMTMLTVQDVPKRRRNVVVQ